MPVKIPLPGLYPTSKRNSTAFEAKCLTGGSAVIDGYRGYVFAEQNSINRNC